MAYLILAHQNPRHLLRMVSALNCPGAFFFIHVDKKSSLVDFESMLTLPNAMFLKNRIYVNWGGFSIVRATLNLIETALNHDLDFDYYILLSGADYPVRSPEYIRKFFMNKTGQFISLSPMPISRDNEGKSIERLEFYFFESLFNAKFRVLNICHNLLRYYVNIVSKIVYSRDHRAQLNGMVPHAGHQWWALSAEAIHYVVSFTRANPCYNRFFKYAQVPDEMYFHTIIANSEFAVQAGPSLTYSEWQGRNYHPEIISMRHVEKIIRNGTVTHDDLYGSGEFLFVRKIAAGSDDVLDLIDRELRSGRSDVAGRS